MRRLTSLPAILAVALAAACAALGINLLLQPVHRAEEPYLFFFSAVLISAWAGGQRSGLIATAAGAVLALLAALSLDPAARGLVNHGLQIGIFSAEGVLVSLMAGRLHSALERSSDQEAQLRALIDGVPDYAILRVGGDGRILSWNAGAEQVTGYRADQIVGQPLAKLFSPEQVATEAPQQLLACAARPGGAAEEGWCLRSDGTRFWCSCQLTPLAGEGRRRAEYSLIMRDSSARHASEQAQLQAQAELERRVEERTAELNALNAQLEAQARSLRQSEAQLRRMGHLAKIGSWSLDLTTGQYTWSHELFRLHDMEPGESPAIEQALAFFAPHDRATIEEVIARTVATRTATEFILPMTTAAGRKIWVHARGEPICEGDQLVGLSGTFQDITERKRLEDALHTRDMLFRTLFRVIPIGVTISDAAGQILEANPASEAMLGISRGEQQQRRVDGAEWQIIRPDGSTMPPEEFASVRAQAEQRLVENVEMGVRTPAGQITWLNVTAIPMPVDGYGAVVVYSDISQRIAMEHALRTTLSERETMLKEIHHRVKNNLQVVVSLLRLQGRRVSDAAALSALRESRQRVEVIALVHELLYRTDNFSRVNAATYINQLGHQLAQIYAGDTGSIALTVEAEQIWLSIDQAVPCGLIIHELISNSYKYAFPDGRAGTIGVQLDQPSPEQIRLRVWDDGVGLPEPDPTRRRTLGVQLVHDLAHQLRGSLVSDGEAGTTSTIIFPAARRGTAQAAAGTPIG